MKLGKKLTLAVLTVAASCVMSGATFAKTKESLLFVETADSAVLTATTLTLKNISNNTIAFADRPERKVFYITTKKFINMWDTDGKNSFKMDPPNAAIVDESTDLALKKDAQIKMDVMKLSNPIYDSSTKTLTYQVHFLNPAKVPAAPQKMHDVAVFIDNWFSPRACGTIFNPNNPNLSKWCANS